MSPYLSTFITGFFVGIPCGIITVFVIKYWLRLPAQPKFRSTLIASSLLLFGTVSLSLMAYPMVTSAAEVAYEVAQRVNVSTSTPAVPCIINSSDISDAEARTIAVKKRAVDILLPELCQLCESASAHPLLSQLFGAVGVGFFIGIAASFMLVMAIYNGWYFSRKTVFVSTGVMLTLLTLSLTLMVYPTITSADVVPTNRTGGLADIRSMLPYNVDMASMMDDESHSRLARERSANVEVPTISTTTFADGMATAEDSKAIVEAPTAAGDTLANSDPQARDWEMRKHWTTGKVVTRSARLLCYGLMGWPFPLSVRTCAIIFILGFAIFQLAPNVFPTAAAQVLSTTQIEAASSCDVAVAAITDTAEHASRVMETSLDVFKPQPLKNSNVISFFSWLRKINSAKLVAGMFMGSMTARLGMDRRIPRKIRQCCSILMVVFDAILLVSVVRSTMASAKAVNPTCPTDWPKLPLFPCGLKLSTVLDTFATGRGTEALRKDFMDCVWRKWINMDLGDSAFGLFAQQLMTKSDPSILERMDRSLLSSDRSNPATLQEILRYFREAIEPWLPDDVRRKCPSKYWTIPTTMPRKCRDAIASFTDGVCDLRMSSFFDLGSQEKQEDCFRVWLSKLTSRMEAPMAVPNWVPGGARDEL